MAVLDPVIGPSTDFLFCLTSKVSHGGTVGSEAVGCDCCRRPVTPQRLLHECESGRFIAGFGDVALEDFAFVVDGAPKLDHLTVQFDVHLVEMPTPVPNSTHGLHPLAADVGRKHRPEPVPPKPDSLMAEVDAALEQQILNVPQRQGEPHVHHHD